MVCIAQLVEPRLVEPAVVGSSPATHPIHAHVAQLEEYGGPNARVGGPSPSMGTS